MRASRSDRNEVHCSDLIAQLTIREADSHELDFKPRPGSLHCAVVCEWGEGELGRWRAPFLPAPTLVDCEAGRQANPGDSVRRPSQWAHCTAANPVRWRTVHCHRAARSIYIRIVRLSTETRGSVPICTIHHCHSPFRSQHCARVLV